MVNASSAEAAMAIHHGAALSIPETRLQTTLVTSAGITIAPNAWLEATESSQQKPKKSLKIPIEMKARGAVGNTCKGNQRVKN